MNLNVDNLHHIIQQQRHRTIRRITNLILLLINSSNTKIHVISRLINRYTNMTSSNNRQHNKNILSQLSRTRSLRLLHQIRTLYSNIHIITSMHMITIHILRVLIYNKCRNRLLPRHHHMISLTNKYLSHLTIIRLIRRINMITNLRRTRLVRHNRQCLIIIIGRRRSLILTNQPYTLSRTMIINSSLTSRLVILHPQRSFVRQIKQHTHINLTNRRHRLRTHRIKRTQQLTRQTRPHDIQYQVKLNASNSTIHNSRHTIKVITRRKRLRIMHMLSTNFTSVLTGLTIKIIRVLLRVNRIILHSTTHRTKNLLSTTIIQMGTIILHQFTSNLLTTHLNTRSTNRIRNLQISNSQVNNRHITLSTISMHIGTNKGQRSRNSTSSTSEPNGQNRRHATLLNPRVIRTRHSKHNRQRQNLTRPLICKYLKHTLLSLMQIKVTTSRTITRLSNSNNMLLNRLKVVYSRSRRAILHRLLRRIRSLRKHIKIRHSNQLINRRSIQIISRNTNSNSTLRLPTKRLIQLLISIITRPSLFRNLTNALPPFNAKCTKSHRHRLRIQRGHLIQGRIMTLRRRTSHIITMQVPIAILMPFNKSPISSRITTIMPIRTTSSIRRHNLTKAQQTRCHRRFTITRIRTSIVRHLLCRVTNLMLLKGQLSLRRSTPLVARK